MQVLVITDTIGKEKKQLMLLLIFNRCCDFVICCFQGHVLVNNYETVTGLVTNSSIRTLLTRECLKQVNYSRDCVSEVLHFQHLYCMLRNTWKNLMQRSSKNRIDLTRGILIQVLELKAMNLIYESNFI